MLNFKSLTIWIIVLNFFIIVGAGHGGACIGVLEIFWLIGLISGHPINHEYFSFSLNAPYEHSLFAVALFSLIGQLLLILSFALKNNYKFWVKILGLLFLWLGFYYLTHNLLNDSAAEVGFWFGMPFIICSGILIYRIIKQKIQRQIVEERAA